MICANCKQDKPEDAFYARYKTCKDCINARRRAKSSTSDTKTEQKSVTINPEVIKLRPNKTKPAASLPSQTEPDTDPIQNDVDLSKNTHILVIEACQRLNRHNPGKVMREVQALAQAFIESCEDQITVERYLEALEIAVDEYRHPEMRDAARKRCDDLKK